MRISHGLPTDFQAKEFNVETLPSGAVQRDDYELNCDTEACYLTVWHARYEDTSRLWVYLDTAEPVEASCRQFRVFQADSGTVMGAYRNCDEDYYSTPARLGSMALGNILMLGAFSNTLGDMQRAGEGDDVISDLRVYIDSLVGQLFDSIPTP